MFLNSPEIHAPEKVKQKMKFPREPLVYVLTLLSFESSAFIYSVAGIAMILQDYYHVDSAWQENIPLFLFPLDNNQTHPSQYCGRLFEIGY